MTQKFVSETFARRGAFHESCDIIEFDDSGDEHGGIYDCGELGEPLIGDFDDADIGLDRRKRIICGEGHLFFQECVE